MAVKFSHLLLQTGFVGFVGVQFPWTRLLVNSSIWALDRTPGPRGALFLFFVALNSLCEFVNFTLMSVQLLDQVIVGSGFDLQVSHLSGQGAVLLLVAFQRPL